MVNSLPHNQIGSIIEELFPGKENNTIKISYIESRDSNAQGQNNINNINEINLPPLVNINEIKKSMLNKNKKTNTAPGPDGITKKVWLTVPDCLLQYLVNLFNECLVKGIFPDDWKTAKLVLLPKTDKITPNTKYRPICLLNEIGKIFERLIVNRMKEFMNRNLTANLSSSQYGFREGFSTLDPLILARDFINDSCVQGEYVVAVAIDISNAFNSLPWKAIIIHLKRKNFPEYIIQIINNYLDNRKICYVDSEGILRFHQVFAGVPQGSVLGPLLWNVTYDWVLEAELPNKCRVLCYADDTLILASGSTLISAIRRINIVVAVIINRIVKLGLKVAANKTNVVVFHKGRKFPEVIKINVLNDEISSCRIFKYLGVIFDTKMTFKPHIQYIESKATKMMRLLWRIMPNLRGPNYTRRKLYVNIVHSVILYASPVWGNNFVVYKTYQTSIMRIQRCLALRVISAYRTVSYKAATLMAKIIPMFLIITRNIRIYERLKEMHRNPDLAVPVEEIVASANVLLKRQWRLWLSGDVGPGIRVIRVILPVFDAWLEQNHCCFDYHTTQMFTGHGSFGEYMFKIRKVDSSRCEFCDDEIDSPEHAISYCPAWAKWRFYFEFDLQDEINWNNILSKAIYDKNLWSLTRNFCRKIMSAKEHVERQRQQRHPAGFRRGSSSLS